MKIHEKINQRSWYNKSSNIKGGFIRFGKGVKEQRLQPYWIELEFRKYNKKEFFDTKF